MGRKRIDLTGQHFGKLTVIREVNQVGKYRMWLCKCACGNTTTVKQESLRSDHTKSCGCMQSIGPSRSNRADHTSKRFGTLVAIKRVGNQKFSSVSSPLWLCRCDCGNSSVVTSNNLISGHTKSCGCLVGVSNASNVAKDDIVQEIKYHFKNNLKRPSLRSLGEVLNTTHETVRTRLGNDTIKTIWDQLKGDKNE